MAVGVQRQPETRYARSGSLHIAYQTLGDGPQTVIFVTPSMFCTELMWEYAPPARALRAMASVGRLVVFDRRGCGLSDPVERPATLEEQVADVLAVMDAADVERAAVFAEADGNPMALVFAAVHPNRLTHLYLHHPFARLTLADDYPYGQPPESVDQMVERLVRVWGSGRSGRTVCPTLTATDPAFVPWWARNERFAASPGTIGRIVRFFNAIDVRDVLPQVRVPTMVGVRPVATWPGADHARYVAEQIPNARLAELPGRDSLIFGDGIDAECEVFEEFFTGARPRPVHDRLLATVLFTDIAGSTERAAQLGDARWLRVLEQHDAMTAAEVARHGGRLVKTTGDGALATFDGPARGVRAARAIAEFAARDCGVQVRAGLHTGEVELRGDDVAGVAVHVGARVAALAGPGEVLVSSTVKDLVLGSELRFGERGEHELKGVPDRWRVFRVVG